MATQGEPEKFRVRIPKNARVEGVTITLTDVNTKDRLLAKDFAPSGLIVSREPIATKPPSYLFVAQAPRASWWVRLWRRVWR